MVKRGYESSFGDRVRQGGLSGLGAGLSSTELGPTGHVGGLSIFILITKNESRVPSASIDSPSPTVSSYPLTILFSIWGEADI